MDLAVLWNHSVEMKDSEKQDKYIDLFKMTVVPVVIGVLGTMLNRQRNWKSVNFWNYQTNEILEYWKDTWSTEEK